MSLSAALTMMSALLIALSMPVMVWMVCIQRPYRLLVAARPLRQVRIILLALAACVGAAAVVGRTVLPVGWYMAWVAFVILVAALTFRWVLPYWKLMGYLTQAGVSDRWLSSEELTYTIGFAKRLGWRVEACRVLNGAPPEEARRLRLTFKTSGPHLTWTIGVTDQPVRAYMRDWLRRFSAAPTVDVAQESQTYIGFVVEPQRGDMARVELLY